MTEYTPPKIVSIKDLFSRAWKIVKENLGKIIVYQLVYFAFLFLILAGIALLIPPDSSDANSLLGLLNMIVSDVVAYLFGIGATYIALRFADLQPVTWQDFFAKMHVIGKYLLASILYLFIVSIGFILLIIPGIILATRLGLFPFYIIDKNQGPIQALESSWKAVKGATWKALGFWFLGILLCLLGFLALGVGFLFAFPTFFIGQALLYRTLDNQTNVTVLAKQEDNA